MKHFGIPNTSSITAVEFPFSLQDVSYSSLFVLSSNRKIFARFDIDFSLGFSSSRALQELERKKIFNKDLSRPILRLLASQKRGEEEVLKEQGTTFAVHACRLQL